MDLALKRKTWIASVLFLILLGAFWYLSQRLSEQGNQLLYNWSERDEQLVNVTHDNFKEYNLFVSESDAAIRSRDVALLKLSELKLEVLESRFRELQQLNFMPDVVNTA